MSYLSLFCFFQSSIITFLKLFYRGSIALNFHFWGFFFTANATINIFQPNDAKNFIVFVLNWSGSINRCGVIRISVVKRRCSPGNPFTGISQSTRLVPASWRQWGRSRGARRHLHRHVPRPLSAPT